MPSCIRFLPLIILLQACTTTTYETQLVSAREFRGELTGPLAHRPAEAQVRLAPRGESTTVVVEAVRYCSMARVRRVKRVELTETRASPAAIVTAGAVTGGGLLMLGTLEGSTGVGLTTTLFGAAALAVTQLAGSKDSNDLPEQFEYAPAPDRVCFKQLWPRALVEVRSSQGTASGYTDPQGTLSLQLQASPDATVRVNGAPSQVTWDLQ